MARIDDETKRRIRRRLRKRQKNALILGQQADQKIERLLIRRFDRLMSVRRFVLLWVSLIVLLILAGILQARSLSQYYQSLQPVPGGLYTEGLIGNFTNANPMFANGAADAAVNRLVFNGLFKYNPKNQLVGDLAQNYKISGAAQNRYTVHLKHNINWQDGYPFKADDVVFTYRTIQNIEAQSPLYSSWQGITITKLDDYTVNFDLPNSLSAFPYSLTNGIVPAHLLSGIPAEQLRSAAFNSKPVGTGPFDLKFIEASGSTLQEQEQRISLAANTHYYAGRPKLDGINLITFSDDQHMLKAFSAKQINSMSGLDNIPPGLADDKSVQIYTTPLTTEVDAFFNNSRPPFSDAAVRKALIQATDRTKLNELFDEPVTPANSPLLKGQLGYDKSLIEPNFDVAAANQALDQAGWTKNANGIRSKGGTNLSLTLSAQDTPNYTKAAQYLQKSWQAIGANVQVAYYGLDELQAAVIANHDYDVLLYGISIGVDPDVYAYWDSSQASITSQGHLNLSEYKSKTADEAVEAGRTRSDPAVRAVKYKAFLTQWMKDLPAMPMYQPNYLYISRGTVFNYQRSSANSASDRFYNVQNWMVRQQRKTIKQGQNT
ncbi:MAG TPA: peptide ABC transporter substrate-binding protein [Candidatus Saccharimonadales bacterium]|nr:peptide ABC transporter substrate-binding protein [Candidatus Saccharimonadales bacterium]